MGIRIEIDKEPIRPGFKNLLNYLHNLKGITPNQTKLLIPLLDKEGLKKAEAFIRRAGGEPIVALTWSKFLAECIIDGSNGLLDQKSHVLLMGVTTILMAKGHAVDLSYIGKEGGD